MYVSFDTCYLAREYPGRSCYSRLRVIVRSTAPAYQTAISGGTRIPLIVHVHTSYSVHTMKRRQVRMECNPASTPYILRAPATARFDPQGLTG